MLIQAILFAASPGTITGVITPAIAHSGSELPVMGLIVMAMGMQFGLEGLSAFIQAPGG